MILLDANVLLRISLRSDPDYARTQRVIFTCRKTDVLVICHQTLFEFWAVATRAPEFNGVGMDTARARRWIETSRRMFRLVPDPPELASLWADIVTKHDIKGFRAHDARYVALMQHHGISHLMTYNVKHFSVFGMSLIDPAQL